MSGVPKRILISRTQRNTPSKGGKWGKPGIILCNGGRSRRAICNYVKKRTHAETKKEKNEDGPPGPNWTYAPDANFRTAVVTSSLLPSGLPTVEVNGEYFKTSTINTISLLFVNGKNISDLTGIEGFTALTDLRCYDNSLTTLDVTQNAALVFLICYSNQLNTLDVTQNTALQTLVCYDNSLTTLDVPSPVLTNLECYDNSLTTLDVASPALQTLVCFDNSLNTLDVSACPILNVLICWDNNITGGGTSVIITAFTNTYSGIFDAGQMNTAASGDFCQVADASAQIHFDASYNASIPPGTSYFGGGVTYFPDTNFYDAIINQIPSGASAAANYLYDASINTITGLMVNGKNISDLTGIEGFTALTSLFCVDNSLNTLDVTQNIALTDLICDSNQLTTLDVTQNAALQTLECGSNSLNTLDVSACPLQILSCASNQLTTLDVTQNAALQTLECGNNSLTTLDVSACPLQILSCASNQLTTLDVTQNIALTDLFCYDNSLTTLDVSACPLTRLVCFDNSLNTLDVTQNTDLIRLVCFDNQLTTLDVTLNTALTELNCYSNLLTTLDVSACPLTVLRCFDNNITGGGTSVIITAFTNAYSGIFDAGQMNTAASGDFCQVADASAQIHFDASYNASIPPGTSYFGAGFPRVTYFPDTNFYDAIINQIPSGASFATNYLYDASINTITSLDVNGKNISDLTGIEGFTALTSLRCYDNSLNTLDVTQNAVLTDLRCYDNSLTTLDVSLNTALAGLRCSSNQLTTLDVTLNTALTILSCGSNPLTTLDVSLNTALAGLQCDSNQLTTLDVTQNIALTDLNCYSNSLTTLDVSACPLTRLVCYDNSLTTLDVTQNADLTRLECYDNNFTGGGTSVIITAFTATFSGAFNASQMNIGINPSGDFCKVADAAAVTHFDASYNAFIPPLTNYFS